MGVSYLALKIMSSSIKEFCHLTKINVVKTKWRPLWSFIPAIVTFCRLSDHKYWNVVHSIPSFNFATANYRSFERYLVFIEDSSSNLCTSGSQWKWQWNFMMEEFKTINSRVFNPALSSYIQSGKKPYRKQGRDLFFQTICNLQNLFSGKQILIIEKILVFSIWL